MILYINTKTELIRPLSGGLAFHGEWQRGRYNISVHVYRAVSIHRRPLRRVLKTNAMALPRLGYALHNLQIALALRPLIQESYA